MVRHVFFTDITTDSYMTIDDLPMIVKAITESGILRDNGYITKVKIYNNSRMYYSRYAFYGSLQKVTSIMFELECDLINVNEFVPGKIMKISKGNNAGKLGQIIKMEKNGKARILVDGCDSRVYTPDQCDMSYTPLMTKPNPNRLQPETIHFSGDTGGMVWESVGLIWFQPIGYEIFYNDTVEIDGIEMSIFDMNSGTNPQFIRYSKMYNDVQLTDFVGEWTPPKRTKGVCFTR